MVLDDAAEKTPLGQRMAVEKQAKTSARDLEEGNHTETVPVVETAVEEMLEVDIHTGTAALAERGPLEKYLANGAIAHIEADFESASLPSHPFAVRQVLPVVVGSGTGRLEASPVHIVLGGPVGSASVQTALSDQPERTRGLPCWAIAVEFGAPANSACRVLAEGNSYPGLNSLALDLHSWTADMGMDFVRGNTRWVPATAAIAAVAVGG